MLNSNKRTNAHTRKNSSTTNALLRYSSKLRFHFLQIENISVFIIPHFNLNIYICKIAHLMTANRIYSHIHKRTRVGSWRRTVAGSVCARTPVGVSGQAKSWLNSCNLYFVYTAHHTHTHLAQHWNGRMGNRDAITTLQQPHWKCEWVNHIHTVVWFAVMIILYNFFFVLFVIILVL